jgi:hypothetical protein
MAQPIRAGTRSNLLNMRGFNADFYIAAATVIPVLYLALTLQGNTYHDLMMRWRKANKESPFTFWPQVRVITVALLSIAGAWVIVIGIIGEYSALQALENRTVGLNTRANVAEACVALLVMVAIPPCWLFVRTFFGTLNDDRKAAMAGKLGSLLAEIRGRPPKPGDGLDAPGIPPSADSTASDS